MTVIYEKVRLLAKENHNISPNICILDMTILQAISKNTGPQGKLWGHSRDK